MVKNTERIAKFQLEELKKESISYTKALKFFEGLWQDGHSYCKDSQFMYETIIARFALVLTKHGLQ